MLYTRNNCPALLRVNSCQLDDLGREDLAKKYCDSVNRSEHEPSKEALEERRRNCVRNTLASGNAACPACKRVMAEAPPVPPKKSTEEAAPGGRVSGGPNNPHGRKIDPARNRVRDPGGECLGAESCQRRSAAENRRAYEEARAQRRAFAKSIRDARASRNSTISSAANIISNWKKSIDSNPRTPAEERARFEGDQRIFQKAQASAESSSSNEFTEEESKKISDPGLREDLSLFAEARQMERDFTREDKRLEAEAAQFMSLAERSESKANGLGAASGGGMTAVKSAPAVGGALSVSNFKGDSASSLSVEPLQKSSRENNKMEGLVGTKAPNSISKTAGGDSVRAYAPSLRESLRQKMQKNAASKAQDQGLIGRDRDAFQGDSFDRGLEGAGTGAQAGNSAKATALVESVISEAKQWKEGQLGQGSAGVDSGIERDLASMTGMPGMETASLFDRVRAAHRSCVARDCVNSAKP